MKTRSLALALPIVLITCFIALSGWQPGPGSKDPQDTTKKSKKKSAGYSKKTIITFDENGEPNERTMEEFEGDEGLRRLIVPGHEFDLDIDMPDFDDFEMPELPDFQIEIPELNLDAFNDLRLDALNDLRMDLNDSKFDEFGEEMEALMKERFEEMGPQFEEGMKQMEEQLRNMDMSFNGRLHGLNKDFDEQMQKLELNLGNLDIDLRGLDENLKHLDENLGYMTESIKAFEDAAEKELMKDGYLEPGEKINSMDWSDDDIKFNGKTIKPEHVEKYRKLKEKHLKHGWDRGRPE